MYLTFKTLRQGKQLRCSEVAEVLQMTESAYRKYERSARLPNGEKLKKLQKLFECTSEEIAKALEYHTGRKTKE